RLQENRLLVALPAAPVHGERPVTGDLLADVVTQKHHVANLTGRMGERIRAPRRTPPCRGAALRRPGSRARRQVRRRGCQPGHDSLNEPFRDGLWELERAHIRHDPQRLPCGVVEDLARSALAQVPLQFQTDIWRHLAVYVIAEGSPDIFAAKHWLRLLFEE